MKKLLLSLTLGASVILLGGGSDLFAQRVGQKVMKVFRSQESCEALKGAGMCAHLTGAEAQKLGCPSQKCWR